MTLFWGLPMAGSYCFTRGGAMQVRGKTSPWPHPYQGWPSSKCPGCALPPVSTPPSSDQEPVVCCPTLPPPPLQPKGE